MITITRSFSFDSAHRVLGHQGKCRHLHGHHYVAEVTAEALELDSLGMVMDFSILKERIGGWIDRHWDHNFISHPEDPLLAFDFERTPFSMPSNKPNPTAENIAATLYVVCVSKLPELKVVNVRIYETPNCWADYHEKS